MSDLVSEFQQSLQFALIKKRIFFLATIEEVFIMIVLMPQMVQKVGKLVRDAYFAHSGSMLGSLLILINGNFR